MRDRQFDPCVSGRRADGHTWIADTCDGRDDICVARWQRYLVRPDRTAERCTDRRPRSHPRTRTAISFATPERAATDQSHVIIADGRYPLTKPFALSEQDSGVTYEAAPGARPVFSGGKVIRDSKPATMASGACESRKWRTVRGISSSCSSTAAGRRGRARPTSSTTTSWTSSEESLQAGSGDRPARARQTVTARPEDVKPLLALSEQELHDVQMVVYHNWDNTTRFIDSVEPGEIRDSHHRRRHEAVEPLGKGRPLPPGELPGRARCAGRVVPVPRRLALLHASRRARTCARPRSSRPSSRSSWSSRATSRTGKYVENVTFKGLAFLHAE